MNALSIVLPVLAWLAIVVGGWLGWQLLQQNGRFLLRIEALEQRLDEFEFGEESEDAEQHFSNRSRSRSKIKRDGLKAGTAAPDFRLPRLDGKGDFSLAEFRGRRVLLVFSSPHCVPCNTLAPQLETLHRAHPEIEMLMISKDEPRENRVKVKEHGLTFTIVLQQQWEISRKYGMFATPIAYLIDDNGIIVHDVAVGVEGVENLIARAAHHNMPETLAAG